MAIYNLEKIMKYVKNNKSGNISSNAHRKHLSKLISNALENI